MLISVKIFRLSFATPLNEPLSTNRIDNAFYASFFPFWLVIHLGEFVFFILAMSDENIDQVLDVSFKSNILYMIINHLRFSPVFLLLQSLQARKGEKRRILWILALFIVLPVAIVIGCLYTDYLLTPKQIRITRTEGWLDPVTMAGVVIDIQLQ